MIAFIASPYKYCWLVIAYVCNGIYILLYSMKYILLFKTFFSLVSINIVYNVFAMKKVIPYMH